MLFFLNFSQLQEARRTNMPVATFYVDETLLGRGPAPS